MTKSLYSSVPFLCATHNLVELRRFRGGTILVEKSSEREDDDDALYDENL